MYEDDPVLGVSNANAAELLPLLGLRNNEWYGRLPADDFLGRVLLAQALVAPDAPRATKTHATPAHATVIDPGRSNDYTKRKLEALERIARAAKNNNVDVIWG